MRQRVWAGDGSGGNSVSRKGQKFPLEMCIRSRQAFLIVILEIFVVEEYFSAMHTRSMVDQERHVVPELAVILDEPDGDSGSGRFQCNGGLV